MQKIFNKTNIILIFILFVSIVFRFFCLNKVGGLWYDELVGSYNEAILPNILSIINYTLKVDIHFPLYQILLHYWGKLFSFSDYSLRAFSAICGVLTVVFSYFVGKELKSERTGLICASIFAVNSFLIFYSQEVRMYSLLALLSTIYLFFVVRIKNDIQNKWNYVGIICFAFAVVFTYTIGFIFVFAQFIALTLYILLKDNINKKGVFKQMRTRKNPKNDSFLRFFKSDLGSARTHTSCGIAGGVGASRTRELARKIPNFSASSIFVAFGIFLILCVPLFIHIYLQKAKYAGFFTSAYCDWSIFFVLIQNWFTPILKISASPHYIETLFSSINFFVVIFILLPIVLGLGAIFCSIKKDKFSWVLIIGGLFFLLSGFIAFKVTNFKIMPRYTILIVPNLLSLVGYGFSLIEDKKIFKNAALVVFLIINLFYLLFGKNAAFRLPRAGMASLANMISANDIKKNDYLLVWNNEHALNKYLRTDLNVLSTLKVANISETLLNNEAQLNKLSLDDRKKVLRSYFSNSKLPNNTIYLMDTIYNQAKPGQKFILTMTENVDKWDNKSFINLVNDNKKYDDTSFNDLLTIKTIIDLKTICYKKWHFINKISDGKFIVIVFEK